MPINSLANDVLWWDGDWSFRQEIIIPIDTSAELAKFQPVDVYIGFENPCWAKNEIEHSVRVVFQEGENLKELESQIYDLNYSDDVYIKSCGLVFLIPEEANNMEQYYVYYDDIAKPSPNYPDHVEMEEAYYFIEPISGYPLESRFFKITDEGYIVYAVAQEGTFMSYSTSQHVTKLRDETKEVLPKYGELFASFDFRYYYGQEMFDYSSTNTNLVSKEILVDGNLMVECGIVSRSERNDLRTTATYKYYYCPTENKRIHAHVKHEVLKEGKVDCDINTDGIYAFVQSGGAKSNSIQDLNFGEILPYIHVYNEAEMISEYPLDPDPEYIPEEMDIRVLSNSDDVDLGTLAWASYDEGPSGISHALIFGSTDVVQSGEDERDGIQINAYELDYPHLPGLEGNSASLQFGRNSFEVGGVQDRVIPKGFVVEFDAEFFSSETGGFSIIPEEAAIFQSLVNLKPTDGDDFSEDQDDVEKHTLTVFVYNAPSFPMGSGLSVLTGRNFSYIGAELYTENDFISSGSAGRLSMRPLPDLSNASLIQRILAPLFAFEWRNFTFFKKIRFQNIEPGRYIVKIFKENPFRGERKYIGFAIIDLQEDSTTRIFCKPERSVQLSIIDQNGEAVENAEIELLKDDTVIAESHTDASGESLLKAPLNSYDLRVSYNGFIIYEEPIKLRYIRKLAPLKKSISIERYDLKIEVVDTWGLSPEIELNPVLSSKEMNDSILISSEKQLESNYLFTDLIPANYQLRLDYKAFSVEEEVEITNEKEMSIVFPAEFIIKLRTLDNRGSVTTDAKIIISRGGKSVDEQSNESGRLLLVPPGIYNVDICNNEDLIGARKINVFSERSFDFITTQEPLFPLIVVIVAIIFILIALFFTYVGRDYLYFLKIIPISLAIIAIISPWWILHGSTSTVETTTTMFLIPIELVTTTVTNDVIAGELASLPDIFVNVVTLILLFTVVGCLLISSSILFKKFNKELLYKLSLILALVGFIGSLLIFFIGMSGLAEAGVGSFIGEGSLDIAIPGEETGEAIYSNWGPSVGFYIYVVSIVVLVFTIIKIIKKST